VLALSGGQGCAIAYFNQAKRWHQTMLADFVRWTGSASMSTIASLDRLEPVSPTFGSEYRRADAIVRPARRQHRALITEIARSCLPPLVADALDLHEHSVVTAVLSPEHAAAGLQRGRTGFVVEADGQIVGAALCETGSRSLSLFNILNTAFVFFREGSRPARDPSVQASLLSSVRAFYARRGISDPIIVVPTGLLSSPDEAGLSVVESMGLWAASSDGLRQWRNYIHLQLGARFSRRNRSARVRVRRDLNLESEALAESRSTKEQRT
jgi:hypothetical protein